MTNPTFRLAHLSDLHLGYSSGSRSTDQGVNIREQDGYDAFSEMIDDVIANNVDAVIVAGDIFHTPKPSVRSIVYAQIEFRRLALAGIKVYSLAGNHDATDVRADVAASKVIDQPDIGIYSHVEPYVHYEIADGIHVHLVSHHMYGEQEETMQAVNPVPGEINIFSTHGSVIDSITKMRLATEQSPREIIIPDSILNEKDWSYRLLGHVHERGFVGSKDGTSDAGSLKTFYNGSLIRRGFADKETALGRGWTLWNIYSDGTFVPEFRTVHQRPQYDLTSIDCSDLSSTAISELIVNNLKATSTEDEMPIVRQKLSNMTPAKYSSLDWSAINNNNGHTLSWKLDVEYLQMRTGIGDLLSSEDDTGDDEDMDSTSGEETPSKNVDASGLQQDLLEIYDRFAGKSDVAQELEDKFRDRSVEKSRKFIDTSRQAALGGNDD